MLSFFSRCPACYTCAGNGNVEVTEESVAAVGSSLCAAAPTETAIRGDDDREASVERAVDELVSLAVDIPLQSPVEGVGETDVNAWLEKTMTEVKANKVLIADIGSIEKTLASLRVSDAVECVI